MIHTMQSADRFPPGRLRSWELSSDSKAVLLRFDAAVAEITIDRYGTVRVRAVGASSLGSDPAASIVRNPLKTVGVRVRELDEGHTLVIEPAVRRSRKTPVWRRPTLVVDGRACRIEARITVPERGATARGSLGRLWAVELLEFSSGGAATAAIVTDVASRYWGFGEKTGPLNKRGRLFKMRTRDMPVRKDLDPLYAAIPFFMWSRPAWKVAPVGIAQGEIPDYGELPLITSGCLLECFAPSEFDISRAFEDRVVVRTYAWGLDVTFFAGPTPREVLGQYVARTGFPPLPPLWALGYHQSRWSYEDESQVFRVAEEFASKGIPLDVIHLDIDYMDDYKVFTWDDRKFPDPKRMAQRLAEMGIRLVAIVDPGVKVEKGYDVFEEGLRKGVFCKRDDGQLFTMWVWPRKAAFVDFNDAEARAFWGPLHERLFDSGVSGIWNDMNEPAGWRFDVRVSKLILPLLPQNTSRMRQVDPTAPKSNLLEHEIVRNIYAYQECRALVEHLEKTRPDQRHFLLTRSGYAGIQRFGAMWTGDMASSWTHLSLSVRMLLGLSLSGVGFCGADIGGLLGRPSAELYARWIQLGSLYPFSRTHSQGIWGRQEPYSFGAAVEGISKDYISMRMRLLAYLYGLFAEYSLEGMPPWRAAFVEFPDASDAYDIEDEVMLGPSLLVAPVTSKGARSRAVYFPPGEWIPIGSDLRPRGVERFLGDSTHSVEAPLEWMPVFARAGSVIPCLWPAKSTAEIVEAVEDGSAHGQRPLLMKVFCYSPHYFARFAGSGVARRESDYYEDDFTSTGYSRGEYARYRIELEQRRAGREGMALSVSVGEREGSYEPRLSPITWEIWCPPYFEPSSLLIDGKEAQWSHRAESGVVTVETDGPIRPCRLEALFTARHAP